MLPAFSIYEQLVLWATSCREALVKGDREKEGGRPRKGKFLLSGKEAVSMASNSSTLPRVTFEMPEKPGEESSHRKLGKLTIKYNRKDLQRWLDLEEWINTQLQELYQCRVSSWDESASHSSGEWDRSLLALPYASPLQSSLGVLLLPAAALFDWYTCGQRSLHQYNPTS